MESYFKSFVKSYLKEIEIREVHWPASASLMLSISLYSQIQQEAPQLHESSYKEIVKDLLSEEESLSDIISSFSLYNHKLNQQILKQSDNKIIFIAQIEDSFQKKMILIRLINNSEDINGQNPSDYTSSDHSSMLEEIEEEFEKRLFSPREEKPKSLASSTQKS